MPHTGHSMGVDVFKSSSLGFAFSTIFIVACSAESYGQSPLETTAVAYESSVGWLHGNCYAIKNSNVLTGDKLTIVQLGKPQIISSASVIGAAKDGEKCFPLLEDRRTVNVDNGYLFYLIDSEPAINLGIAVVDETIQVNKYVFDYCTTTEGVLYSLKKLNQNNSSNLWQGYYYLGYESEATCDVSN